MIVKCNFNVRLDLNYKSVYYLFFLLFEVSIICYWVNGARISKKRKNNISLLHKHPKSMWRKCAYLHCVMVNGQITTPSSSHEIKIDVLTKKKKKKTESYEQACKS